MRPPDFLDERRMRYDPVAVSGESLQYPMLERGQTQLAPVAPAGDTPAEIDRDVPEFEHPRRQLAAYVPPHDRTHARKELRRTEWLHDVVVRTILKRCDSLRLRRACRQYDDWHRRPSANAGDDNQTVPVGQTEVDHHDIRSVQPRIMFPASSRIGNYHAEAICLEQQIGRASFSSRA